MIRSSSRQSGFTLLEVMVALAVIATAFTALLGLHVRNLETMARENAFSRSLLLAETLAAEALINKKRSPASRVMVNSEMMPPDLFNI